MKLLVVGASGFIGTNFILAAPRNWEIIATYNKSNRLQKIIKGKKLKKVKLVKCNLTDEKSVRGLQRIIGKNPINVLYLAANSDPQISIRDPIKDLKENTLSLVNFLEKIAVNKLLYFSSGAVYDGIRGSVNPNSKLDPKLPYAISKLACEQYIKHFHKIGKVKQYVIIRFFGAYGPYEPSRKIYSKLIQAFYINKQKNFTAYGDGKNLIDAVYIDQITSAIKKILLSKKVNLVVDLCHAKPITIDQLVKKAAKTFGIKNPKIKHIGKSAEPIYFRPSQKGMHEYFGIQLKDNLDKSLKKFAEHFKAK